VSAVVVAREVRHWLGLSLLAAISATITAQLPLTGLAAAVAQADTVVITLWAAWALSDQNGGRR
jgi:hypothetical protein